jgi:tetratricopeptide (TPR) repeat protein
MQEKEKKKKKSTGKIILKGCLFSILGFFGLSVLFAIISVFIFSDKANEKFELAEEKYNNGNFNEALNLINESIKIDSLNTNSKYYFFKGKIEKRKGDTLEYKNTFNIAINSIKNDTTKYYKIIDLYEWNINNNDTVFSKELILKSLRVFSKSDSINFTNSYLNAHNTFQKLKDTISSIEVYKELCDSLPNPVIFNQLGIYYSNKIKRKTAIKYYKKAIELDSTNGVFYNNLGITYQNIKNKKGAIKYYKLAVKYKNRDACSNLREITAKTRYRRIARCWDGTMTYSLGRGACSHHGGVRRFENEPYKEYTMNYNCE